MSASLHWKPVPKAEEDSYLSHDLMFILRKRYWDDGVLSCEATLTLERAGGYVRGLADAGVADADKLLQLLTDHPEGVILYHEF